MDTLESAADLPMLADMRRQAEVLARLVERRDTFEACGRDLAGSQPRRIAGFGSGDGWFAARSAVAFARRRLNLDYQGLSSLELLSYAAPSMGAGDSAAIAVSMSGSADRTNEAAEAVIARGAPVLALTNGSGGALAGIATAKVSLEVPDVAPFLTGTAKYVATLAGLLMILEGAAGRREVDWSSLVAGLPELLDRAERFARGVAETIAAARPTGVRVLSAGPNLATAEYGVAKFIKLVTLPIWWDEVEEFAHRQFWSCPASDLVIYVAANPAVARCATSSAAALAEMGVRAIAIDTPDAPVASAAHRLTLPKVDEALSPLVAAIPLQFLAYFTARALGGAPDRSQEVADPARFRAAQLLSRRGELTSDPA